MADQFPRFSDGNVDITLGKSDDELYGVLLHSHVLALHLQWFKASLSERWSGRDDGNFLDGTQQHWVYELRFDKGSAVGILLPAHAATADTELLDPSHKAWAQLDSEEEHDLFDERVYVAQALVDVLRLVYHGAVEQYRNEQGDGFLGRPEKWLAALHEAGRVYGCDQVVGPVVDQFLGRDRKAILEECRSQPIALLKVALKCQSDWIFKEAATHLLGSDQTYWLAQQEELEELNIAELLNKKRQEFVRKLEETEEDLLMQSAWYFANKEDVKAPPHASAFFEAWLSNLLEFKKGSGLRPGYAEVYRRIWMKNYANNFQGHLIMYLLSLQPQGPQKKWPTSQDTRKLAGSLHDLASWLQRAVNDVMRETGSGGMLDAHNGPVEEGVELARNLTFMEIKDEELPWSQE